VDEGPAARLRNAQDLLAFLRARDTETATVVLASVGHEVREHLEQSAGTMFWPLELDASYVDTLIAVLGEPAARELWRTYARRFLQTPLLRSLAESSLRLLGATPGTLARQFPRGWSVAYRNCGTCKVERSPRQAIIRFEQLAPQMLNRPGYVLLLEEMVKGMHDVIAAEPDLIVHASASDLALDITVRW